MSERFFSPESMLWRVDREMALLLGGGRALLMQLAHPKVAAGVADHSHFAEDPLGRLHRTMNTMWSIVFDKKTLAQASLDRVSDAHRRVQGTIKSGEPLVEGTSYDAFDPGLLFWVHATLVDSAIRSYDLFVRPLSLEEKKHYYEDSKLLARLFEIPDGKIPESLDAFNDYMQSMIRSGTLSVGPVAQRLAREVIYPRRPFIFRLGSPLNAFITAGLLPAELREGFGYRWDEKKQRRLEFLARLVRSLVPLTPSRIRLVSLAHRAQKEIVRHSRR